MWAGLEMIAGRLKVSKRQCLSTSLNHCKVCNGTPHQKNQKKRSFCSRLLRRKGHDRRMLGELIEQLAFVKASTREYTNVSKTTKSVSSRKRSLNLRLRRRRKHVTRKLGMMRVYLNYSHTALLYWRMRQQQQRNRKGIPRAARSRR